jgi:RES domain-containing protein
MRYFRLIEAVKGRSGLGYGLAPGRWNQAGTPLIYACNASSLNFLELLSIKGPVVTQSAWKLIVLEVSELIPSLDASQLPHDWKNRPHPSSTQEFGSAWAKALISPALKVPSCRIPLQNYPTEHNLLLNPLHPEFQKNVQIVEELDVSFEVNG